MPLPIETTKPSIEEYYSLLRKVQKSLLECKSEISRLRRLRRKSNNPDTIAKIDEKIEKLTDTKTRLENVIQYARKCHHHGHLDEALKVLKACDVREF